MPFPDGFEGFVHEKDGLRYVDEYRIDGTKKSEPFSGRELVRRLEDDVILFEMEYRGQLLQVPEGISKEDIFRFLRESLMEVPREAPFRGPKYKIEDESEKSETNLEYYNHIPINFSREGIERIMFTKKGEKIQTGTGFDVYLLHYKIKKFEK